MTTTVRRLGLLAMLAFVGLMVAQSSAWAHALLKRSDPAAGASLRESPHQVVLTFTEPPDPGLSSVTLLDSAGRAVDAGKVEPVPEAPLELRVELPELGEGVYTVNWRTVSKTDGHVTAGTFAFGVGRTPAVATAQTPRSSAPSPSALAVAGKWALFSGLALAFAGTAVVSVAFGRALPGGGPLLLALAWVLAFVGFAATVLAEKQAVGVSLSRLAGSATGRDLIAEGVAVALTGIAVLLMIVHPARAVLLAVGVVAALGLFIHTLFGHADGASSFRWFNLGVQWLHLLAVAVWIGGLVWLLLGIRGEATEGRRRSVVRFSRLAGIALAIVAATGLARALDELGGWRHLFDTSFGVTLLVKIGLFGVLVALGALNRYRIVPAVSGGTARFATLRRVVSAEIAIAAAVIAASALLSQLPPAAFASSSAAPTGPRPIVVSGSDFATSVRVRLTVTPGTVGRNSFEAVVTDYDTGNPAAATSVQLRFSYPSNPDVAASTLPLSRGVDGVWRAGGTTLSLDGLWKVEVVVQEADTAVDVPLQLRTQLPAEDITASGAPGQPTVYTISLAGGRTLQAYIDPGELGRNAVHFTFFQPSGSEQPVADAEASAVDPSGSSRPIELIRFDPGHFASNVDLVAGRWVFRIDAHTADGRELGGYFAQDIGQ